MRNATLRQVRAMVSVATHMSFARAAEELHLTPPAVSLQIAQLEREAGVPLFERLGRRLHLTPAGEAALRACTAMLGQLRSVEEELAALRGVEGGLLNVGVISAGDYFFADLLASFCSQHAGVRLSLSVCNRDELLEKLDLNLVDLGVMGQPPEDEAFAASAFAEHPIVIVASPKHALAGARRGTLASLAGVPFIAREQGSLTRSVMDETLRRARVKPAIAIEAASTETIKRAVAAGFGVAFVSAHAVAAEIAAGRLALIDVEGTPVRRQWFSVHRRGKRLPAVAAAFVEFLGTEGAARIRELVPPKLRRIWKA